MSSTMMNVISSTTLIEERRINFLANRYFARDTARSVISQIFDIIDCVKNLKHFKLLNQNIPELIMYAYFIESVPEELLESSRWLQEYKIYNDVNMADFKATTLAANHLIDDLFANSLKISAYIGTWENESLSQKLEKVKDIIHWPPKELDDEIKLNLAYQTFPKIKINILSGREVFADQFIGNILDVATEVVSHRGLVKSSSKGSDLENVPISELCCHCESSENTIDNIGEERHEKGTEESQEESEDIQEKVEKNSDIASSTTINGQGLTQVVTESSKTLENEGVVEGLRSAAEFSVASSPSQYYPLIRDFTIQKGKTLVEKIVSKWCFDAEWMHFIQYHDYSHDKCTEYHKYEISFNLEGSNYFHHPEAENFNQNWLYAILCNKIKFFKRICSMNTI